MAGSHPLTHTQVNPTDIGSKQTDITCQNGSLKLERHYRFSGAREWISYPFSPLFGGPSAMNLGLCRHMYTGGLRCPDLIQRCQALFSLAALCVLGCPNPYCGIGSLSLLERRRLNHHRPDLGSYR